MLVYLGAGAFKYFIFWSSTPLEKYGGKSSMERKKLSDIEKEHPRLDANFLQDVLDAIKGIHQRNKDATYAEIAQVVGCSKMRVHNAMHWLEEYKYVKRTGSGDTKIFYRVNNLEGDSSTYFTRSGEVESMIENNLTELQKIARIDELQELRNENFGRFLQRMNDLVKQNWDTHSELVTVEIQSIALRFAPTPKAI